MPSVTRSALLLAFAALSASSLSSVAAARPALDALHTYTFEQYVKDFRLGVVAGSEEYKMREGLFAKELARVVAHNAAGKSWKETVNQFSTLTSAEMKVRAITVRGLAEDLTRVVIGVQGTIQGRRQEPRSQVPEADAEGLRYEARL
jgi:hypothetical protein